MNSKTRNRILNLLKIFVSLGVLAVILAKVDLDEVFQLLGQMNWLFFASAVLLFLAGSLVRAYRWGSLVWALGVRVSWWRLVGLYFVGAFFSLFLPTGVGGDAVKAYELSRDNHKTAAAISSVLVDRFLGLFVLLAVASLTLIGGYQWVTPLARLLIAVMFTSLLVGGALLLQRTWIERWGRRLRLGQLLGRVKILRELYQSIHVYGPAALLRAVAASAAWNIMLIVGYYLLGLAVGINLSLWYYCLFIPIVSALLVLPSLGGLGIREASTMFLFTQVGVGESQAAALALAYDSSLLLFGLIGAVLYIMQGVREARQ